MTVFTKSYPIVWTLVCLIELCLGKGDNLYIKAAPHVTTTSGNVRGIQLKVGSQDVTAFLGIPYAEPPIGDLRFKKPLPVKSWQGVYDAITKPPPCIQCSNKDLPWVSKATSSENCLYLNIWIPGGISTTTLPVLVWIYGGGFYSGSTELDLYDGATIATEGNVIVVSLNYRVGAFGFLNSGTSDAPGNMGMYDQNLALRWIKANIKNFCGDPDRITLFGESAGSISVGMHIISPMSRDLFKRAIMQSNGPYHPILADDLSTAKGKGSLYASSVGCANDKVNLFTQPDQVVECLKQKTPLELANAESSFIDKVPAFFVPGFGDEFLPQSPVTAMDSGDFKSMEVLIGNNHDEGSVFLHLMIPQIFGIQSTPDLNLAQGKQMIVGLFQNSTHPPPQAVADFYLKNVAENDTEAIRKAIYDSYGDFGFLCPTVFFAEKMTNSVYYYLFTHRPNNSLLGQWFGVAHFEEVPFVFGIPIHDSQSYTEEESRFSRSIIQKWTSFAKHGLPVGFESSESWPKFTSSSPQYLELNPLNNNIGNGVHTEACNFWRKYLVGST